MNRKYTDYFRGTALVLAVLLAGCAGYGQTEFIPSGDNQMTIEYLIEHSDEYVAHYSGYAPNNPSGLIFDPRNEGRALQPSERWVPISGPDAIREVKRWLDLGDLPGYYLSLRRIRGAEGNLYGYVYTGWQHLVMRQVDESTLYVYDLPDPPHYYGSGDAWRRGSL